MSVYRLKVHKSVKKFLQSLPPKWQQRFSDKLDMLIQNPYSHPELDIKAMQGDEDSVYRLRVAAYRLIYQSHKGELIIFLITAGSREDVYK